MKTTNRQELQIINQTITITKQHFVSFYFWNKRSCPCSIQHHHHPSSPVSLIHCDQHFMKQSIKHYLKQHYSMESKTQIFSLYKLNVPTQVRHILTLFSAYWLLTLADRLSPLSMVANPRKAPTRLYTTYEKIQLQTATHPGTNAPNVA